MGSGTIFLDVRYYVEGITVLCLGNVAGSPSHSIWNGSIRFTGSEEGKRIHERRNQVAQFHLLKDGPNRLVILHIHLGE
jgi:hypothetical protein